MQPYNTYDVTYSFMILSTRPLMVFSRKYWFTHLITISEIAKPRLKLSAKEVAVGENLKLSCHVSHEAVSYEFYFKEKDREKYSLQESSSENVMTYTVAEDTIGSFSCNATYNDEVIESGEEYFYGDSKYLWMNSWVTFHFL